MAQLHTQQVIGDRDIVSQLIRRSFSLRSVAEQKFIVQQPRPLPRLNIKTGERMFQQDWYLKKDWLCGSEERRSVFCWPCLLFRPGVSTSWTESGYSNMRNVLFDCKKHEK